MKIKNQALLGRASLVTTTLIWGSSFVILKSALDSIMPLWVLAIRFSVASVIMLLPAIPLLKEIDRRYLKGGLIMGALLATAYISQTYGLYYTTPAKNAFLTSTYCIFVPFIYWIVRGKAPSIYNISAAVLCVVGVNMVSLNSDLSIGVGDLLTIVCGLFYGLHIVATDRFAAGRNVLLVTLLQFAVAAVICFIFALIFEPAPTNIPRSSCFGIAYLAVMCTGACFFLQTLGQKYTPPSATAVIMTLESVFGAAVSIILGKEALSFRVLLGFAVIFISVIISETKLEFLRRKKYPMQ